MKKNNRFDATYFRKNHVLKEGTRLTNYNKTEQVQIGKASFEFDYRRDKFHFSFESKQMHFLGLPKHRSGTSERFLFTNSGQAAMNAIYFYVNKKLGESYFESQNDYLYVGAYRLQALYNLYHTRESQNCLWICSTATDTQKALRLKGKWKFVIVDTTCWRVGSTEIQRIFDHFKSQCDFLIFFRSHSKLDMGGVEYGSLGSLCLFSEDEQELEKLNSEFQDILGLSGGFAILDEIPPYIFEEDFYDYSQERVLTLERNCKTLKSILKDEIQLKSEGCLIFPDHYKYFFLRFAEDTPSETLKKYLKKLNFILPRRFPDIKSCASFGFNFPSVSFYASDEKEGHFFRFCPGIIDEEQCHQLAMSIKEIFQS